MLFRNDGTGEANIIQNKFTSYLQVSIQRRKKEVLNERDDRSKREALVDYQKKQVWKTPEQDFLECLDFMEQIEDELLLLALRRLKKRDRYILIARVLEGQKYEDLAEGLGMGYKGVAAAYSRTIEKLRKELGGDKT